MAVRVEAGCIAAVSFAVAYRYDAGNEEQELETEDGGFQGDVGDAVRGQKFREQQQRLGGGLEGANGQGDFGILDNTHASDHDLFVNIQPAQRGNKTSMLDS